MRKIIIAIKAVGKLKLLNRYENKVTKSDPRSCWNWNGATINGYGYLMVNKKVILAHRLSWFFNSGAIPEALCVCHHCDNRQCVNPRHLFIGTKKDNARDAENKGRLYHARGSDHPQAKLTEKKVVEIRRKHFSGISQRTLAREYDVSQPLIGLVARREYWRHV